MFELTKEEYDSLSSQFATLKRRQHSKYLPFAFTEQGVAMLPAVLEKEVNTNKQDIALIFKALKQLLTQPKEKRQLIGFKRYNEEKPGKE